QLAWGTRDEVAFNMGRRAEAARASAIVGALETCMLGWRNRGLDHGFLPFAPAMRLGVHTPYAEVARLLEARVLAAPEAEPKDSPRPSPAALRALISMSKRYPGPLWKNLRSPYPRAAVETFLEVFSRTDLEWKDLARLRGVTDLP